MKKQFFRVKQLADQAIARAEKSAVLTDDLAASERRVEALRVSCSGLRKRLTDSLSCPGSEDHSKKLRKISEFQLATSMKESAQILGLDTLLGRVLHDCGDVETRLAQERIGYESELEQTVLDNSVLQQMLDADIPHVIKLRKQLSKLTLDMDSTRNRYQNSQRHTTTGSSGVASSQLKNESFREELDSAQVKVEQHRDMLAGDMFQLLSREPELAHLILQLIKLQTEYFRSSLQLLEAAVPSLEAGINSTGMKPVFGLSLEEHLRVTDRQIAAPLEMCVQRLLELGTDEEGLFRIAGSASKVRKLKSCLDAGLADPESLQEHYQDPHVIADALKGYLRDLPEPLMTSEFYPDWMSAAKVQDEGQRLQALWQVLHQLPDCYYVNLRYLIKFLAQLCQEQKVTKMSSQNLAIVIAPNLLWAGVCRDFDMVAAGTHTLIVESLINHCDWFFKEDVDFFASTNANEEDAATVGKPLVTSEHDETPDQPPPVATPAVPSAAPPLSCRLSAPPITAPSILVATNGEFVPSSASDRDSGFRRHRRSNSTDSGALLLAASSAVSGDGVVAASTTRRQHHSQQPITASVDNLATSDPPGNSNSSTLRRPSTLLRRKKQAAPTPPAHAAVKISAGTLKMSPLDGASVAVASPLLSRRPADAPAGPASSADSHVFPLKDLHGVPLKTRMDFDVADASDDPVPVYKPEPISSPEERSLQQLLANLDVEPEKLAQDSTSFAKPFPVDAQETDATSTKTSTVATSVVSTTVAPPIPAPRASTQSGPAQNPAGKPRPERPPPPSKVDRTQSFTGSVNSANITTASTVTASEMVPSAGAAIYSAATSEQRVKPAIPVRPGSLYRKRTKPTTEAVASVSVSVSAVETTPVSTTEVDSTCPGHLSPTSVVALPPRPRAVSDGKSPGRPRTPVVHPSGAPPPPPVAALPPQNPAEEVDSTNL